MKDVKDSEGRSVKILGRAGLIYQDKTGKYFVDSEMLVGPQFDIVVYANRIRLYSEHNGAYLSGDKKDEVLKMIIKLLASKKMKVDIQM